MLITFKTLEQKTFKIEIDETEKVKALKEKIAQERGGESFPVAGQKLIYSGKILDDDKLISECNIDPVKNFVVVMVVKQKPKATDKPKESETTTSQTSSSSASSSASATSSTSSTNTESSETSTTPMAVDTTTQPSNTTPSATTTTAATTATSQDTTGFAESALLTGSSLESSITELMSLGYSREQVMRALNRSFHNADRAAEYLLSGNIPDAPDDGEDDAATTPAVANTPASAVSAGDLSFLRNLPQFQLMRQQVQAHPESLPQLLQEIGRSNPELLSVISQHQEAFIALLNETGPTDADDSSALESGAQGGAGGGGPLQIQVTATEKEAIDRMVSMGFAEGEVIQAFFACDKNEQLAIEFLLN